jgi:hypothetical protein
MLRLTTQGMTRHIPRNSIFFHSGSCCLSLRASKLYDGSGPVTDGNHSGPRESKLMI